MYYSKQNYLNDSHLKSSWTPVHKLDRTFGLNVGDGSIYIFGYDITTIQHTAGHVLPMSGVTLHHLIGWLKAGAGYLRHRQLLVVGFLSRNDRRVCDKWEVNSGIWHQIGLELGQVYVQGSIKSQGCGDGRHDLTDETVQIGVGWSLDVKVSTADVVDGLVIYHEGTVRVLQGGVGGKDGVIWLDHSSGDLRSWINGKLEL